MSINRLVRAVKTVILLKIIKNLLVTSQKPANNSGAAD